MEFLYSPWRSQYFTGKQDAACVFCDISNSKDDRSNFVFHRDSICFGVMNLYPYTPGHFMLIPHRHVDSPSALPMEEWTHISQLAHKCVKMLEKYGAEGINMGINIKKAGGAGIPEHLHLHFVPRFQGDTNFITAIGDSRVYGINFEEIFDRIAKLSKEILR